MTMAPNTAIAAAAHSSLRASVFISRAVARAAHVNSPWRRSGRTGRSNRPPRDSSIRRHGGRGRRREPGERMGSRGGRSRWQRGSAGGPSASTAFLGARCPDSPAFPLVREVEIVIEDDRSDVGVVAGAVGTKLGLDPRLDAEENRDARREERTTAGSAASQREGGPDESEGGSGNGSTAHRGIEQPDGRPEQPGDTEGKRKHSSPNARRNRGAVREAVAHVWVTSYATVRDVSMPCRARGSVSSCTASTSLRYETEPATIARLRLQIAAIEEGTASSMESPVERERGGSVAAALRGPACGSSRRLPAPFARHISPRRTSASADAQQRRPK